MKRPLSVWLVQILLTLECLILLPPLILWTVLALSSLWGSARPPMDVVLFYVEFTIKIGLFGFFVYSIIAIGKRWPKSRMVGLTALLILFAYAIYCKFNTIPPGQGLPKFVLNSPAERGGAFIGKVLRFVGFWVLFFHFGFSEKSRKFFLHPNPDMALVSQEAKVP